MLSRRQFMTEKVIIVVKKSANVTITFPPPLEQLTVAKPVP